MPSCASRTLNIRVGITPAVQPQTVLRATRTVTCTVRNSQMGHLDHDAGSRAHGMRRDSVSFLSRVDGIWWCLRYIARLELDVATITCATLTRAGPHEPPFQPGLGPSRLEMQPWLRLSHQVDNAVTVLAAKSQADLTSTTLVLICTCL